MGWTIRALLTETWRNLGAYSYRTGFALISSSLLLGLVAAAELQISSQLLAVQADQALRGANVVIVKAESGLSAARCEAARSLSGVVHAGGLRPDHVGRLASAPSTPLQVAFVTPGFVSVASPAGDTATGKAVLLGVAAATDLRVTAGSLLAWEDGEVWRVGAVVALGARAPTIDRWVLVQSAPQGSVRECWLEFDPGAMGSAAQITRYWFSAAKEIEVRAAFNEGDAARDLAAEFRSRPQSFAWIFAGIILTLVYWVQAWFRRPEFALYHSLGAGQRGTHLMLQAEVLLVTIAGMSIGGVWSLTLAQVAVHAVASDQLLVAAQSMVSAALLFVAMGPLGAAIFVRGSTADLLKDL